MTIAIRRTTARGEAPPPGDNWLDALSKLIPGELMIAHTAALQVASVVDKLVARLAIASVFAALVPVWLWRSAKRAGTPAPLLQHLVRTAAFALYALGSDRVVVAWLGELSWLPPVGGIAIAVLAALALVPPGAAAPPTQS